MEPIVIKDKIILEFFNKNEHLDINEMLRNMIRMLELSVLKKGDMMNLKIDKKICDIMELLNEKQKENNILDEIKMIKSSMTDLKQNIDSIKSGFNSEIISKIYETKESYIKR